MTNEAHGGRYGAVYFAVLVGPDHTELAEVEQELRRNFGGRYFGSTISNCDLGAQPALAAIGIPEPGLYTSLHFATLEDARQFADGLDPGPLAVAMVQTYRRDGAGPGQA